MTCRQISKPKQNLLVEEDSSDHDLKNMDPVQPHHERREPGLSLLYFTRSVTSHLAAEGQFTHSLVMGLSMLRFSGRMVSSSVRLGPGPPAVTHCGCSQVVSPVGFVNINLKLWLFHFEGAGPASSHLGRQRSTKGSASTGREAAGPRQRECCPRPASAWRRAFRRRI